MSGKTSLCLRLLTKISLFTPKPAQILYYYDVYQEAYGATKQILAKEGVNMLLYKGIDNLSMENLIKSDKIGPKKGQTIIIIDDFSSESSNSKEIAKMVTNVRHCNASCWLILHSLFNKSDYSRIISQNVAFIFLLPSPRLASQLKSFGNQLNMASKLVSAYEDVCFGLDKDPYPYLLLDMRPSTPKMLRLRAKVDEDFPQYVYI